MRQAYVNYQCKSKCLLSLPLQYRSVEAAANSAAAWQPGAGGKMAASATSPARSCKTVLHAAGGSGGGKSLTETMASSLAEALGVEIDGADERFKVGGGGYGGGGGASVGTIDDKVTGDKVGGIFELQHTSEIWVRLPGVMERGWAYGVMWRKAETYADVPGSTVCGGDETRCLVCCRHVFTSGFRLLVQEPEN